jgi:hypothetical protein
MISTVFRVAWRDNAPYSSLFVHLFSTYVVHNTRPFMQCREIVVFFSSESIARRQTFPNQQQQRHFFSADVWPSLIVSLLI